MSRLGNLGHKLYAGEVQYDFVGRRRRWYTISAAIVLISVLSLAVRGLNLGVEFEGGNVVTVPTATGTVQQAREVAASVGAPDAEVLVLTTNSGRSLQITTPNLSATDNKALSDRLASEFNASPDTVTVQEISPSWGGEITKKGLIGLGVFIVLIALFLTLYFEWRMAVAALIALVHDLVITVGIYSLVGFTVTPATLIGVLTILGYSLYDTVVVFDKVRENTRGIAGASRMTYSQAANLAVNQTLVRSINTSVVALLPVAAILFVGPLLGAGTLKDLSLALFVGIAAGTYSSIFIATPVLAQLKEREPAMQALAKRVQAREAAGKAPVGTGPGRRGSARSTDPVEGEDDVVDEGVDDEVDAQPPATSTSTARQPSPQGARPAQRQQPRRPAGGRKRPANKKRR
jgi:preprotein translocase subunit SecF